MKAVRQDSDRLADTVYEQVKADIFEFRLLPGARFSENELAARARVSRTPVREALLRLAREGFLEVHAKSGWSVRPLDFERFEHLYDVRVILELAAVRKLCTGDFGDALAPLKKVWLVPQKQRLSDWKEVAGLDEDFNATLLSAARNPELARMMPRCLRMLDGGGLAEVVPEPPAAITDVLSGAAPESLTEAAVESLPEAAIESLPAAASEPLPAAGAEDPSPS